MNELDSHLEKTSEIFKIGSVEKKLQPFKVGNKPKKSMKFYQNFKEILDFLFEPNLPQESEEIQIGDFEKIQTFCAVFFTYPDASLLGYIGCSAS